MTDDRQTHGRHGCTCSLAEFFILIAIAITVGLTTWTSSGIKRSVTEYGASSSARPHLALAEAQHAPNMGSESGGSTTMQLTGPSTRAKRGGVRTSLPVHTVAAKNTHTPVAFSQPSSQLSLSKLSGSKRTGSQMAYGPTVTLQKIMLSDAVAMYNYVQERSRSEVRTETGWETRMADINEIMQDKARACNSANVIAPSRIKAAGRRDVSINPRCNISSDIASMWHTVDDNSFHIQLRRHRRCQLPVFRFRLSGRALVTEMNISVNGLEHIARYHVNDAGLYFLEILVLFCERPKPNDFSKTCLLDGTRNVLNLQYSVVLPASDAGQEAKQPRWRAKSGQQSLPLQTRYQPPECMGWRFKRNLQIDKLRFLTRMCDSLASESSFDQYEWIDEPNWTAGLLEWISANQASATICVVGASHARFLSKSMTEDLQGYFNSTKKFSGKSRSQVRIIFVETRYPWAWNVSSISTLGCSHVIVGFGQWSAGWHLPPDTVGNFTRSMQAVVNSLGQLPASTRVFIRSVNYNPHGGLLSPSISFRFARLHPVAALFGDPHKVSLFVTISLVTRYRTLCSGCSQEGFLTVRLQIGALCQSLTCTTPC